MTLKKKNPVNKKPEDRPKRKYVRKDPNEPVKAKNTNIPGNAYTDLQIEQKFESVIVRIENGYSLKKACKDIALSQASFYKWLDNSDIHFPEGGYKEGETPITIGQFRQMKYARAAQQRADSIFEECLEIADSQENDVIELEDGTTIVNYNVINRNKLQVDTRKWFVSKLNPKKYGDKIESTLVGDATRPVILSLGNGVKPED